MDYRNRIKKLQKKLRRKKVDALLVTQPHNRRYLSGYTSIDHNISESSGALLIPAQGKGMLLTDFRYQLQAQREVADLLDVRIYTRGLSAFLKKLLSKLDITTLAFESDYLLHSTYVALQQSLEKLKIEFKPVSGVIEKMREVKDAQEIELIRQSVQLNEQVFQQIYQQLEACRTEIDVALLIEQTMRRHGAEGTSFDSIVASADNSALPHAVPTTQDIIADKPLTIDMGLVLNGYCSDMTRSFIPGKPSKKYKKVHRIVRKAQLAGMAAIKAGVTGKAVDKAARDIIAEAGYGKNFGHSLGHGVGLAVHEAPRLSTHGTRKLKAGMIVTVEPGIYIPGWGGIRLEDMVVVTEDGCENLNSDTTWLDL